MSRDLPNKIIDKTGDLKKSISSQNFNSFGLEDMAYVKTVDIEGQKLHAVHAADGTPLTVINTRDLAFATVRQHEMEPLSVH
ncbi:MAG: DUF1150 family protein [Alphaproteobacteria bacterium]|nr:DUF1150 family protein [Alphaproteobacteria bacterium]